MNDATLSLLILAGTVALFVWNRLSVGTVALLTALALYLAGVLDVQQVVGGFGDPVVIFIATLFIVSEGLDATGVTTWAGQLITKREGMGRGAVLATLMLLSALLSAVISPNGAAAALLPVAVVLARRVDQPASRMMMPLAFAASAGALLTLSGSPVNVLVSDAASDAGAGRFGFFEFAIMGVPLVGATILVALVLGPRLLPDRVSASALPDFSAHTMTLLDHYALDRGFFRLRVRDESPLAGLSAADVRAGLPERATLIGRYDAHGHVGSADTPVRADDVLVVSGPSDTVERFAGDERLIVASAPLTKRTPELLVNRDDGVAEVVIPPRSDRIGEVVFPGLTWPHDTVLLGVLRRGHDRGARPTELAEGDMLLVHGRWSALEELTRHRDVLLVDSPEMFRRQAVPLGRRAWVAIGILVLMVVLLATGVVPPAIAGLIAAVTMVLTKVVGVQQAYRAISWQTIVLLGGLIPLSVAIQDSGAADLIADGIVGVIGNQGPYVLMLVIFGLTAVLGQIVSNTATTLIVVPIAVAAALETGVSVQPVLMLVAVAGASSFLTPIATPANMIVMGPAGYRFGDYWKFGLAVMAVWLAIAIGLIPLIWPF